MCKCFELLEKTILALEANCGDKRDDLTVDVFEQFETLKKEKKCQH